MEEKMEEGKVNVNESQEDVNKQNEIHEEESKGRRNKRSKNDKQLDELKEKNEELNDKYLRLFSEFDNYRKRTLKEKMDLIESGGEDVIKSMLAVMDDFERALTAMQSATDVASVKEGVELIQHKMCEALKAKGVSKIEAVGLPLDTDLHEAVAKFPAGDDKKGLVIDVVQQGYKLKEKVIRYAKVVVGE